MLVNKMTMKLFLILVILFLFISAAIASNQGKVSTESDWPLLKGPYFGQKSPGMAPEIFAPGIISTEKGELNAVFSPDGNEFYFTIEVVPGRSYSTYYMKRENNIWSKPLVAPLLDKYKGGEPSFSPDGKYLFFRSMLDEEGNNQNNADIWRVCRIVDGLAKADKIGEAVNSKFNEAYPVISSTGALYFHSNREGGCGSADLYYSKFVNGSFSDPVNLGSNINSKFPEFHPCISPDGSYLVFSSLNRPDGFGSIDLYISFRDTKGNWTKAINFGESINSQSNDYMPFVSHDKKYLFFTSNRNGKPDIYWVSAEIIEQFNPKD